MNDMLIRFERRPAPVLAEHRPLYKISQILLVLHLASRGGKSTLPRLHLFNWALKSSERRAQLVSAAETKSLKVNAWGFDPVLAFAIAFAVAEKLIEETSNGYSITEIGSSFIDDVLEESDAFHKELELFKRIGKNITEAMVDEVAKGWEA